MVILAVSLMSLCHAHSPVENTAPHTGRPHIDLNLLPDPETPAVSSAPAPTLGSFERYTFPHSGTRHHRTLSCRESGYTLLLLDYIFNDGETRGYEPGDGGGPGEKERRGSTLYGGGFYGIKFKTNKVSCSLHFFITPFPIIEHFGGRTIFGVIKSALGDHLPCQNNLNKWIKTNHVDLFDVMIFENLKASIE